MVSKRNNRGRPPPLLLSNGAASLYLKYNLLVLTVDKCIFIMKKPTLLSTTTFRNNLADAIDEVDEKEDYILVTQRGEPKAALVNIDFFEDLLMANSPNYIKSIEEARKDFKSGRVYTHEQVFGKV